MAGCGCCAALRPRYKRLVDNIFPITPEEGLVKSNMEKLTFYALSSPEKLDRIGGYLAERLSRDISRKRVGFLFIAMEALDQLLLACHAHSINMFVESFLKMVQELLECEEAELQELATASFVKFANIEEDTPSYHRRYDFFVSKFSAMSHSSHSIPEARARLRNAGLRGLQGVVRKTVSDDLQVNIWEQTHMDKIVPSLLFNMHDAGGLNHPDTESPREEEHPSVVAETCLRDLVCRASFGNIKSILKPVLVHLDNHGLWVPNQFAVKCFKVIMYSVQAQYGYVVVQLLMSHLDQHSKSEARVKASIVDVLAETVLIAAGGSIGPSVLEVFNTLLKHIRVSVDCTPTDKNKLNDEKKFQESAINTIGEFANNLPDYQKIEIMCFVISKVPSASDYGSSSNDKDVMLQMMLLKTLLKVATKYKTVLMSNAFPNSFLEPLMQMSVINDAGVRLIVQEILHTLLDRHNNLPKLNTVKIMADIAQLSLSVEKPPRQDIMFMKKNGSLFYWHLFENMQQLSNKLENFSALYITLALLGLEMGADEILVELFRLSLGMQEMACNSTSLPTKHRYCIHAVVAAYFNLMSQLTAIPALCLHVTQVLEIRGKQAPHLLPDQAFTDTKQIGGGENVKSEWLFDQDIISEALHSSGHDTTKLGTPYLNKPTLGLDAVDAMGSVSDISGISIDLESAASTPGMRRRSFSTEITVETLKRVLNDGRADREEEKAKQAQILQMFKEGPFEEIVAKSEARATRFHSKVDEILDMLANQNKDDEPNVDTNTSPQNPTTKETIPVFEMKYPELFVY